MTESIPRDQQTVAFAEFRTSAPHIEDEDWTEADTRSKFIDIVLKDCLGWQEEDIRRELSADGKRLDYTLSLVKPTIVVEAKRSAEEFAINLSRTVSTVSLSSLLKSNPSLKGAVQQVAEYCWIWSCPIAVLTNGRTYITFLAVRTDGVKWQEGDAVVYSDILGDDFDFSKLHNLLSKDAVRQGRPVRRLLQMGSITSLKSVTASYADPHASIAKNPLGLALEPLLRQVFSDVTQDDSTEVLQNCYVYPGETKLRDEEFEALLIDRPPSFAGAVDNICSQNSLRKFQDTIKDYLSRREWSQTVIVIGGIGVGKTIFLKRFFKVAPEGQLFPRDTCAFFIDFRRPGVDPEKVPELIYERLTKQILELDGKPVSGEKRGVTYDFFSAEALEQVFWPDVQRFHRGPNARLKEINAELYERAKIELLGELQRDDRLFVHGAFRVLRERYHRHVCVILDNADQCDAAYQRAVYLFSRTLENELECLIVVALREEWYWHFGHDTGPISAYHDVVYHIPAPRARDVLVKRLEYAIDLAEKYSIPAAHASLGGNIVLEAGHLAKYLRICKRAFFEDEETTVLYECVANGVVRRGLDLFLEFVRSGHTHVDEYLKAIVESDDYVISFHQLFKSIAYGSYRYYSSARSIFPNLFSPIHEAGGRTASYFSKAYLLSYLGECKGAKSPVGDGFVRLDLIQRLLESMGITAEASNELLAQLVMGQLCEPDVRFLEEMSAWKYLRITAFGLYLVRRLAGRFAYLEAIMLETPFADEHIYMRCSGLYIEGAKPSLAQRVKCVRELVDHLEHLEELEQVRIRSAGIGSDCPPFMPLVKAMTDTDFERLDELTRELPFR